MNLIVGIFVILPLLNISVNALSCKITYVVNDKGRVEINIDNICKCTGFDKPIPKGAGADDPTKTAENTVNLNFIKGSILIKNPEDTCRKAGFSKNVTISKTTLPPPDTTEPGNNPANPGPPEPQPVKSATNTTTVVLILLFSLFFGCLFAWASKIVYNKYKIKEYVMPPDQQEMDIRPNGIGEDTRLEIK